MRMWMLTVVISGVVALPALAQPPEAGSERGDRPGRAARERILRAFDKDGDGRLNNEERDAMREQMGERFEMMRQRMRGLFDESEGADAGEARPRRPGRRADADRQRRGDRRAADRPRRERGDRDRGRARRPDRPRGPRGPMGPMGGPPERNLQALFGWFDQDGDNMLNRREFAELSQFVQRRRPGPPGGPPPGARFGRRGPDGPPAGDREELRRRSREGRLGGPPGAERRDRDERRGREEQRARGERRRDRGDSPRAPRPDNPPEPPATPEVPSADPI